MAQYIEIKNARTHNLKGIDVKIPHNKLVVITGLSGSGKSSLAFDTLYAEGQRRYVESLSAYVRQFMGKIQKPEVDSIKGIAPAIAIEQKVSVRNSHSTVGSSTEIYDYLRLLFARIGKTYSPISGKEVKCDTVDSVCDFVETLPKGCKFVLLSKIKEQKDKTIEEQLSLLIQQGFSRVSCNGEYVLIQDFLYNKKTDSNEIFLVIDRLSNAKTQEFRNRLADSLGTAFYEGNGSCLIEVFGDNNEVKRYNFSKEFEIDGIKFETPTEQFFNFNSPLGACPHCSGFGKVIGIDEDLVIPNKSLSIYENAVACWRGEVMGEWQKMVVFNAAKCNFPIHKPYNELSVEQQKMLWDGTPYFEGINSFFKFVETQQYKVQYRVMLARYRGRTTCPECKGARLRKEAQWIKVGGKSIVELITMPISELKIFFDNLVLSENDALIAKRLLLEIKNRIRFISEVGLGYLRLDRPSNTLSGGESQRINLATSLGGSLVGSLYVLDEPSIGLHSRDTGLLIKVLKELRDAGNTVVVVEHDEDIIRAADYVIDIGPNAGRLGGEVVFQGSYEKLLKEQNLENSHTYNYLLGKEKIQIPSFRKKTTNFIEVVDAHLHNLKHINVKFPLNTMTVVTGVSGSGKSSLVKNVLYEALQRYFSSSENVNLNELKGSLHLLKNVELVDQNPIGKTSRSNPATYLKAYDEIRRLFAEQPLAKQMRFTAAYFSFNVDGGRCEACQGEGTISVEMQFMANVKMECEVCHGKRFKADVLEVLYKEKNIYDVLEMTVNQAIEFFSEEKSIIKRLKPLQDVGLGYIKLGQSSSSLSGGENQRVKLAAFLANERQDPTLFIFDEPTVGLHFHDISVLLSSLNALVKRGHTLVIVEHNMDVIKCADYIIDMGKEGGAEGGNLVFAGTPEDLLECKESYTAQFLREKLKN